VLSHPDYDTMVSTAPDLALTRRLVHAYCDTQQDWMSAVNGTIGRWLRDIAGRSPLTVERTTASTVLSQGFHAPMLGYMFAHHVADVLRRAGGFTVAELDGWLASLAEVDQRGAFLWSINDYAVVCRREMGTPALEVSGGGPWGRRAARSSPARQARRSRARRPGDGRRSAPCGRATARPGQPPAPPAPRWRRPWRPGHGHAGRDG
jgi:hypothetical protein